ncbi:MAG: hypothetical protein ABI670_06365 [Chloroflexota bacterium]
MTTNKPDSRRLLVLSSPGADGDREGPPGLSTARGGILGAIRSIRKDGKWPDNLDLLIISDSYGIVEPDNPSNPAAPIPFSRSENPDWWAGFISRNLDNYISRHSYSAAFVATNPGHEAALRASHKLRSLDPAWVDSAAGAAESLRAWLAPPSAPTPPAASKRRTSRSAPSPAAKASPASRPASEQSLSHAQTIATGVVQDSIYSDRFILAIGKMSGEELDEVRRELAYEWGRRALRRHEQRSVSNFILKAARLPWSDQPASTLYGRVLESFGMPGVLGSINKAVSQLAITEPGRYRDILARMPKDESEFMTDLLYLLWEASSRMDKDEIAILRAYLTDTCTHSELRRLGLSRNLRLEDRYEILRSIISCSIGLAPFGDISDYRRLWIRLDEIENLLNYPQHERWEMVKALQTLVGDSPHCLTIWLNISPTSQATAADIQAALENNLLITDDLTVAP